MASNQPNPPQPSPSRSPDTTSVSVIEPQNDRTGYGGENKKLIILISVLLFLLSSGMIFLDQVNSLPKLVVCALASSFAFSGFFNLFSGSARITIGKWFTAGGAIAVAIFLVILILYSVGLIKGDLSKIIQTATTVSTVLFA